VIGERAVFVDRDGVLNALVPDPVSGRPESPLTPGAVTVIPGAAEAIRRLAAAEWRLVGVSNQPAAAKGTVTLDELRAVHERVIELLAAEGAHFDDFRLCLHHPDGVVAELSGPCNCRKPAPGMLLEGAESLGLELSRSWMVGDTDADVQAGRAAGCATILIEQPESVHKRGGDGEPDATAPDLATAADLILHRKG
jgi:D-glycero-D-manno-heptose 1,7-bisphosphate phosphatase